MSKPSPLSAFRLLLNVLSAFPLAEGGWTSPLTRTELTRRFCHHAGREGSVAAAAMYDEWIPYFVRRDVVRLIPRAGKPAAFAFRLMSADELENHLAETENEFVRICCDPQSQEPNRTHVLNEVAMNRLRGLRSDRIALQAMLRSMEPHNPALPSFGTEGHRSEPRFRLVPVQSAAA